MAEIECKRCGKRGPGLGRAPLPGPAGLRVADGTCTDCWEAWLGEQVKLINEKQLSPVNPAHYQILLGEMQAWLKLGGDPA